MSNNYIVINGKKMDLTEEQLKQLGIKLRKNPFDVGYDQNYYYINSFGIITQTTEKRNFISTDFQNAVNYFNDKNFAEQVGLHQLLYRKLLKFAYDNRCEATEESNQYYVNYCPSTKSYTVQIDCGFRAFGTHFSSYEATERAINEVVEPFVKEHPQFVW